MRCFTCKHDFPDDLDLVKPFEFMGRWLMVCPICAADHGGVKGINYGRAKAFLEGQDNAAHEERHREAMSRFGVLQRV